MFPQLRALTLTSACLFAMAISSQVRAQNAQKPAPAHSQTQTKSASSVSAPTHQAPAPQAAPAPSSADRIDVSDLEKKYWAAKDTDFNVVQNRLYSKAGRLSFSGFYGTLVNDPWSTGPTFGGTVAYYFSERYGIEAEYSLTNSDDNQAAQRLKQQGGYPDHNQLRDYYGLNFEWVPFYAKMSVLNSFIMYFDMGFSLGGGMQTYTQKRDIGDQNVATPALEFNVTQHYFMSKNFGLRVDLKNRWYQEDVQYYKATTRMSLGNSSGTSTSNSTYLLIGMTVFF